MTAETGIKQEPAYDLPPADTMPIAPVSEVVLKVQSRCNLNCDYCYVYNLGDNSWRDQPKAMSEETLQAVGDRIGEYIDTVYDEPPVTLQVTYHGGEPLLLPPEFYDVAARTLRKAVGRRTVLKQGVQTNGTLLSVGHLDAFRRNRIGVGVSLDGDEAANDRHRLNHAGKSSHDESIRGIQLMRDSGLYRKLFEGVLAVIDVQNDPLDTYRSLRDLEPPSIDFLLPHANWDTPPPGITVKNNSRSVREHPYADWLNAIFDVWLEEDIEQIRIRTFDSIIREFTGGHSTVESIGGSQAGGLVVVETDGSYEMVDTLKSAPGQVNKTGLHVRRNSLHEANMFMAKRARQLGALSVSEYCGSCPVFKQCGAGYVPHRYSKEPIGPTNEAAKTGREASFANPSVYCGDLLRNITHIYGGLNSQVLRNKVYQNIDAINAKIAR